MKSFAKWWRKKQTKTKKNYNKNDKKNENSKKVIKNYEVKKKLKKCKSTKVIKTNSKHKIRFFVIIFKILHKTTQNDSFFY